MKYSFHPSAKIELQEAINYYEEYHSGLGLEFAKIYSTIQRLFIFQRHGLNYPRIPKSV